MRTVSEFLQSYAGIVVILELVVMTALLVTFQIKQLKSIREMNHKVTYMTDRLKAYFQTIITEEEEEEKKENYVSKQESDMRKSLENTKKKQDEAIIDAVLQEIFP